MTETPTIFIGVGSNIDPRANIPRALDLLQPHARVLATSTFYRTPAINRPEQPPYLNGLWRIATAIGPRELKFDVLRKIEDQLGRIRTADKYAARPIDLDVLLYGSLVLKDSDCCLPAPELRHRPFLQAGLLELAPDLILPDTNESLASLVQREEIARLEADETFTAALRDRLRSSTR